MLKKLLYLKENAFEKTMLFCQNKITWLLKNTAVPKRKQFWKRLLYLEENTLEKVQNKE